METQIETTQTATPTAIIRRADERGLADHGWLKSRHTFSFAEYYDPAHMGFRALRVINEDRVAPRGGFPSHPHRDMEIFSYVVSGQLRHEDSLGNKSTIKPGEIQVMSAGSGVVHSEFNPSGTETVHFLQIWITPEKRGLTPRYTEWTPAPGSEQSAKVLLISGDGRENSATIARDAEVYRIRPNGGAVSHDVRPGRGLWLQVIKGPVTANGTKLESGDALALEAGSLEITGATGTEALLFDLD